MDISNLLIDAQDTDTNEQKNSDIKISNHLNKTNKVNVSNDKKENQIFNINNTNKNNNEVINEKKKKEINPELKKQINTNIDIEEIIRNRRKDNNEVV
ncbi:hypothetical protein LY90DRAFT_218048 [Neocallimastix californiae]|uniref:Uncharacterized protein n=1 Tax=Neocallimastix californiae TaxID=1754190 RepID=A0A1Y1YY71_9FUNG|nr:hypothetical protein LY90DRAFT_218048 [Neocallimastix californiae]|eukprot:ORY02970.1 hypothetical protein LY90DRAFT_218048 [Neocallimastix californiae]